MRAYYALVDDILKWDEFEEAVYAINPDSDDDESEKSAAAEVVRRHGRLHPKISKLNPKPTLNSFFCKVIEKEPLKDFIRPDKSPGLLRRILAGDETGEVVLVFWDERAYAAEEISPGDILEVAVRFKNISNVNVVDLRRADAEVCLRERGIKTLNVSAKAHLPIRREIKCLAICVYKRRFFISFCIYSFPQIFCWHPITIFVFF